MKKTPEEKKATQEKCRILWWEKNIDKAILQAKEWKLRNPERNKELKRIGYHRNAEKINARRKVWNKENRERVVERQKAYYRKNKQRIDAYARRYAKSNPERIKESRQRHWEKNRVSVFWSRAKKAAKEKGIKFDITKDWFKVRLDAGVCEMSGLPFDMKGKRSDNSPSIDRIKPAGDYTMDNCRMVLWSINRALGNCGERMMAVDENGDGLMAYLDRQAQMYHETGESELSDDEYDSLSQSVGRRTVGAVSTIGDEVEHTRPMVSMRGWEM